MARPSFPPPPQPAPPRPRGRVVPLSRPLLLDYFLLLFGLGLSLWLGALSGLHAVLPSEATVFEIALGGVAPLVVFLPLGVILLWPLFHLVGRVAGRSQPLALGEWLWGLAWLVSLFVSVWIIWKASGAAPEAVTSADFKATLFAGYAIYLLAIGVMAFLVWLLCLFSSTLFPWTHALALALLIWPMIPMALIWLMGWRLEFVELGAALARQ